MPYLGLIVVFSSLFNSCLCDFFSNIKIFITSSYYFHFSVSQSGIIIVRLCHKKLIVFKDDIVGFKYLMAKCLCSFFLMLIVISFYLLLQGYVPFLLFSVMFECF